ncbi:TrkA C-terminal domain-containing protein [Microbacterium sp. 2FI]|uniref:cation:proton antiporter regulatory subunit n=1 Tax=Microbacterium sp. 2FI TaxID=2502193 RepID=UPI0010F81791|nr:TrkA C-terminal domain-containing protein [Microbacterium sp. 2FI]
MPVHVERADLPGIGVRHDILTDEGRRLSVINFRDGGRELALADEDDPDRASETIVLTDDEATALSEVLGGSLILTQLAGLREQISGLFTEQIPVRADSPFVGRALGETKARTRTRCSIIAIVRDTGVLPAPEPADLLHSGDTLVAVGTREGLEHLVRIIAGR